MEVSAFSGEEAELIRKRVKVLSSSPCPTLLNNIVPEPTVHTPRAWMTDVKNPQVAQSIHQMQAKFEWREERFGEDGKPGPSTSLRKRNREQGQ